MLADSVGLTEADLEQYALLAGRSGGQILNLGLDSGDGGEIHSTAHATKGTLNLCDFAYFDEVNDKLGIGTATPKRNLDIAGDMILGSGGVVGNLLRPDDQGVTMQTGNGRNSLYGELRLFDPGGGNLARMLSTGEFGIGTITPSALLHVDQSSEDAATPVLILNQADVSEEFIKFIGGTIHTGKSGADEYLHVETDSGVRYLKLYT